MAWATLQYSKGAVARAGQTLINGEIGTPEMGAALEVVENWRACHGFALNSIQMALRRLAKGVDDKALIAQRTKRLPAIKAKLERMRDLTLAQMQDLGGCRAIVRDVSATYELARAFDESRMAHRRRRPFDDYIATPRSDTGYRGIHVICTYHSNDNSDHNGRKIEVQLRSRPQHVWATAVEAVGTYTRLSLKANQGDARWIRYFKLMSTFIAAQEGTAPVEGTPNAGPSLREELRYLGNELNVFRVLSMIKDAGLRVSSIGPKSARYFIVRLDASTNETIIERVGGRNAQARYSEIEQSIASGNEYADAVLVSVKHEADLRKAYPNYYLDVRRFLQVAQVASNAARASIPWMRSRKIASWRQQELPLII